ncbi:hypothetical protein F5Y16DRAFT_406950 [Xylariaceae sp. FL0255]|nr:hypothetical protein F5Y16DRAFT_406950 [Xylariaceae sp. FL0255]
MLPPEIPLISRKKYEKKRNTIEEPQGQTIHAASAEDESDDDESVQIKRNRGTWMISDLTASGKLTYDADNTYYDRIQKIYEKQAQSLEKLKSHVIRTVANHYKSTSCLPEKTVWEWYDNIQAQCGKAAADEQEDARRRYKAALMPLKNPRHAPKWVAEWEIAFNKAEQKGVPETKSVSSWANDFLDAITEAFPVWTSTYAITKATEIRYGTLKFRDLVNDFRAVVNRTVAKPGRATKGAFGASYHGEEQEEDDDTSQKNKKNKPRQGAKRKARGGSREEDRPRCPACGQLHTLARCYYVFPEKAFEGFQPRDHIVEKVTQAMEEPQLQAKIRALKRGKSKTRTPQPKEEEAAEEIQD